MVVPRPGQSALDPEHVGVKYLQGLGLNHDLAERLSTLCIDAGKIMKDAQSGGGPAGLLLEVPEPRLPGSSDDPHRLPPPKRQTKEKTREVLDRLLRPIGVDDPQINEELHKKWPIESERTLHKSMKDSELVHQLQELDRAEAKLDLADSPGAASSAPNDKTLRLGPGKSDHSAATQKPKKEEKKTKAAPLGLRPQDCEEPPEGWYRAKDLLAAKERKVKAGALAKCNTERIERADKPGAAQSRVSDQAHPLRQAVTRKRQAPHSARAPSSIGEKTPRLPPLHGATGPVSLGVLESATMMLSDDAKLTAVVRHPRWLRTGGVV